MSAPNPRVALGTYAALPALNDDDALLATALREQGARAEPAVWDDRAVAWERYDVVVIRSMWDYHHRYDQFVAWLDHLARHGVPLVNPDVVVRWNADKRYLRDLARAGVSTVPTRWMERGDAGESLETVLVRSGWNDVVVKPVVSASAHQTWRISGHMAARERSRVASLVESSGAVLVQPFVAEVLGEGEWSLVFIAGEYSHAALKRPAAADFRVQWEHGGRADPAEPPPPLVHDAQNVVAAAARRCGLAISDVAYARVDGVQRDGRLLLMELECLEPHLFLSYSATAATRLARAVLAAAGR